MRAILTSLGTLGDVQPMFALGDSLQRRGHDVVIALSPNYADRAKLLGLPFAPIGPAMRPEDVSRGNAHLISIPSVADQTRYFLERVAEAFPRIYRDLLDYAHGADVLVSIPHQFAGRMIHEKLGIPFVSISLAHFGDLGARDLREASAPIINECRRQQGLPPLDDPLSKDGVSAQLALYAVSRRLLARPPSWPAHHKVTGFFYLDEDQWQPPADLVDFVFAGPPPIAVSFSSMMHRDPAAVTKTVLTAVETLDQRAVLLEGWSGLSTDVKHAPNVFVATGFVPHGWLFPKASCIVHHGGAGTSAAAFRSGVPAVVVPHFLDQPIWAEFARGLGCAGGVVPLAQLSADRLTKAIANALETPRTREAAKKVADFIAAEDGVSTAADLIERFVAGESLH